MGESFSAQLSTGIATYSIPIGLPKARGKVQPSLVLSYSSAGGYGGVGMGWALGSSSIARKTDRGTPNYGDTQPGWHPNQDRFVFGGAELVPICIVASQKCTGALTGEAFPAWANGWQYFRSEFESSYYRFFWSPDRLTWRVQAKDGTQLEFGVPLDGTKYEGGVENHPTRKTEVLRWHIVRQYDVQGLVEHAGRAIPLNAVVYRHFRDGNVVYLSDIFDTSPAATPTSNDLSTYAHHTRIVYEERPDRLVSFRAGWQMDYRLRVARVDVTSKPFNSSTAARQLVRRYHFGYDNTKHTSILTSFQQEGRCAAAIEEDTSQALPSTSCPRLPAVRFEYQSVSSKLPPLADSTGRKFEPFATDVKSLPGSPAHTIGQRDTGLLDINGDSLPDVLVASAGQSDGYHSLFLNAAGNAVGFAPRARMGVQGVSGVDAGVLRFSNPRVSTLDLDADGRVNLVHMPEYSRYSVFTPSFSNEGWTWLGQTATVAQGDSIKVDWTRNARHTAVMDVNGDGLVDVVYASSTELQTFFALGRYPGGEGRFGQARWTGAKQAALSSDPIRSCMPWSATPVRFGDPDVHVADMNGDGLSDIVRVRSNQVLYWPGRGNGTWGTGERDDCRPGGFGFNRAVLMKNPPAIAGAGSGEFIVNDVNGDGMADVVRIRTNAVDLVLNENGLGFTGRLAISNTPNIPNNSRRVVVTDIDGSGTPDLLWGEARNYRYIDLMGGTQPHVLRRVQNGLGATTELEYKTSTQLMLAAAAAQKPWSSVMPITVPVVVRATVRDNLEKAGRPKGEIVTEYSYRDPVFDGRTREFRGFREAESRALGDENSPTSVSRSEFLLGHVSDEQAPSATAGGEPWREALKGVPVVEEELDATGVARSTKHTSIALRSLYTGLDGRQVWATSSATVNAFLYDTAAFDKRSRTLPITDFSVATGTATVTSTRSLLLRATAGVAQLRTTTTYDGVGNLTNTAKDGCVAGCPTARDERITIVSRFGRPASEETGWLWRETSSYVVGSVNKAGRSSSETVYDKYGNVLETYGWIGGTLPLQRADAAAPLPPNASGGQGTAVRVLLGKVTYDTFGNPKSSRGPNGSCSGVTVDSVYAEFATETTAYAGKPGPDGCGERAFKTVSIYDRGFGLPTSVVSAQGQPSAVEYDGFGRVVRTFVASATAPGTLDPTPRAIYDYQITTDAAARPYSVIRSQSLDVNATGQTSYVEDFRYVDGLGRTLFAVSEVDPSKGDAGKYIVAGGGRYNRKGAPYLSFESFFWNGNPAAFPLDTAPTTAARWQNYDAFGRVKQVYLQDGRLKSEAKYHALSADNYDAGDLDSSSPYAGTYTTEVSDGHGRTVLSISRYRNGGTVEEHRTVSKYLPTGEVVRVAQQRTGSPEYVRTFEYDTLGRVVQNSEPNTSAMGDAAGTIIKSWRYAYDDSGRLVGTSDANGCGVNYHYDAGGRPVGSDHLPCSTNQGPYTAPNPDTGDGFETFNRYDVVDPDAVKITDAAGKSVTVDARWTWGRTTSVRTLGAFTAYAYDSLGRTVAVGKRVAKPGPASALVAERYAPRWYLSETAYDVVGRATKATTGAPFSALYGADGTSELRLSYTRRGLVHQVNSSYGMLVRSETRDARGLLTDVVLGDRAETRRSYQHNELTQVSKVTTYRAAPTLWTTGEGSYTPPGTTTSPTTQLTLEDYSFEYDVMGNLTRATDWRTPEEWPSAGRPVSREWSYDSYSRLTQTKYTYPSANTWTSPFAYENASAARLPRPAPHQTFTTRITQENFSYDWLNNLVSNTDDSAGFYDRSTGTSQYGDTARPHRLTSSSNRGQGGTRTGQVAVTYDDAGQVTGLLLERDGTCLPAGSSCWQRFAYEWDVIGNLTRARRWDLVAGTERSAFGSLNAPLPERAADADVSYQYDGSSRVLKAATIAAKTTYTVYPLSTVELRSTTWTGADYALNSTTTSLRLGAGSVSARVVHNSTMPRLGASSVHLLLEFGDHLGSTTFTIDHATSELVQYTTYTSYGTTDSEYRHPRWAYFREAYRFTGKEEDVEVGLNYHGARYYSPYLRRWMSADPVTIHEGGSDFNPYAYGYGNPTAFVDPDGRLPILAVIAIAAVVSATTNAVVQQATTGHVNWGWNGVAGAAVAGAAGGAVGAGVGVAAGSVMGGVAGGATSGAVGTTLAGGSGSDVFRSALTGAVAGGVGAGVGVMAGSQSGTFTRALGGSLVGTAAGTGAGMAFGAAVWGEDVTWESAGVSFSSAFAGTIATSALSKWTQNYADQRAAGRAAAAQGTAAGQATQRESKLAGPRLSLYADVARVNPELAAAYNAGRAYSTQQRTAVAPIVVGAIVCAAECMAMGAAVLAGIVYTGAVIGHEASKIDWGGWFASDDSSTELTPKDAQRAVEKGRGPKGISRIDEPEQSVTGSQWEAHTGGRGSPALKQDGTWKHVPRGKSPPSLPRKTIEWLRRHGWDT